MKTPLMPTSVLLNRKTLTDLRMKAARETLRTGRQVTPSGLIRSYVEEALYGKKDEQELVEAGR